MESSREDLRKAEDCQLIAIEVLKELRDAMKKFDRFNSAHEGFAVIQEEIDELWDEVKKRTKSKGRMREEAIQIAAMAIRFAVDIC
jgi:NTP pyrophosphatase (non-canonical NTP hydrolase)